MPIARLRVVSTAVILLAWAALASAQTKVTTCGQVVTGNAFLSADLDCTGFADQVEIPPQGSIYDPPTQLLGPAVVISKKGTLDLQGHTITGGNVGVYCPRKCEIVGGGTIAGASTDGVLGSKVTVRDTTITGSGDVGLFVNYLLRVYDGTITGNAHATWYGDKAKFVRSTITGNTEFGITGKRIELVDSTATGNGDLDIGSVKKPRLKRSTCGTSSWGPDHLDVCGAP